MLVASAKKRRNRSRRRRKEEEGQEERIGFNKNWSDVGATVGNSAAVFSTSHLMLARCA